MTLYHEWREAPKGQFAVIGDPIAHSLSPRMWAAAFAEQSVEATYGAIRVPQAEFAEAVEHVRSLGYVGLNVTVPLKGEAFKWAKPESPYERWSLAANTIRLADRAVINTDGPGMLEVLRDLGIDPPGPVMILGAGGTARSLIAALEEALYDIVAYNRTHRRLAALIDELGSSIKQLDEPDPRGCVAVINATSAGLKGVAPEMLWEHAPEGCLAYDTFYMDRLTPFQNDAERHGLRSLDGRTLLVAQGALSFEWLLDIHAPRRAMIESIR